MTGPGLLAKASAPAIAFQWPWLVTVSNDAIYVGDRLNGRVVRVDLTHAAEETCQIK